MPTMNTGVYPVGTFLAEEIKERGWTVRNFAIESGLGPDTTSDILHARVQLTPDMASCIGDVFGTSASLWLRLDEQFWSSLADHLEDDE